MTGVQVRRIGIPDRFIDHGALPLLYEECGMTVANIVATARRWCSRLLNGACAPSDGALGDTSIRLDRLLVERGLAGNAPRAAQIIRSGAVRVNGRVCTKPGARVAPQADICVDGDPLPYVGRGGIKLAFALKAFGVSPRGKVALDVGASTGGFTQVLLEGGATKVYAVDVGRDQLHPSLRADPRVVVMEQTDIRSITSPFPQLPEIATIDVSFISLTLVLPAVVRLVSVDADVITLIKPQFELGAKKVGKRGVVRDPRLHVEAIQRVQQAAETCGLYMQGIVPSPITGSDGNVEYLAHWRREVSTRDMGAHVIRAAAASLTGVRNV